MKRIVLIFLALLSFSQAHQVRSAFDFETTMQKIKAFLLERQIPIFAEIDHSQNAKDVGLELAGSKVILFGNPKVGTLLMQENINIAFELPLKIAIIQNAQEVIVEATNIQHLAQTYDIENSEAIEKIEALIGSIIQSIATKP